MLVMAAGIGKRYGGLKQIEPVGPNGEIIIDYSIYDALGSGFGKLVFVIRRWFEEAFREKIGAKFDDRVETGYAYQELDSHTGGFAIPADRERPWGTGHAILVARDLIDGPFAVINADDYYGPASMRLMHSFLASPRDPLSVEYAMVGYRLRNTLSDYGAVARGVCELGDAMFLRRVVEYTRIEKVGQGARHKGENGVERAFTGNEMVSMNLWGFQPSLFNHLETQFAEFLAGRGRDPKAELYIPTVVDRLLQRGQATVKVLPSEDTWFGVTYLGDREIAAAAIRRLIEQGVYPADLWGESGRTRG